MSFDANTAATHYKLVEALLECLRRIPETIHHITVELVTVVLYDMLSIWKPFNKISISII